MQEEGKPSETLPAEGIGCIPATRGYIQEESETVLASAIE